MIGGQQVPRLLIPVCYVNPNALLGMAVLGVVGAVEGEQIGE